jgi:hypothetical protein
MMPGVDHPETGPPGGRQGKYALRRALLPYIEKSDHFFPMKSSDVRLR